MLDDFHAKTADLILEESNWSDQVNMHDVELQNQLKSLVKNQRERELDKMLNITTKATYDTIEEICNPPIYELQNDFW